MCVPTSWGRAPVVQFMSNYQTITVEKRGKVAVLTINRPDKLNALNRTVHKEGVTALDELRHDNEVQVLILPGQERKRLSPVRTFWNLRAKHRRASETSFTNGHSSIQSIVFLSL